MKDYLKVLILGSDANAYYMARCTHEAYNIKAHLIAKAPLAFTEDSSILTIEYFDDLWDENKCIEHINDYANKYNNYKILLVSSNETYTSFIANNHSKLNKNLYYTKQDINIINTLINKELFYKTYKDSSLDFPKTYYYDVKKDTELPKMDFPLVIKPANVVKYNHVTFKDKHKIYKVNNIDEEKEIINNIKNSDYDDKLIIQEFIEGDDSYLHDAVCYVDSKGIVKVLSFAEIGLQERTKSMVGNAACLINGYSSVANKKSINDMKKNIIKFMESLKMNGFYEFDMKYDKKDKKFKVLEINARQGRCSYYISPLGANLVRIMADDLIYKKNLKYLELNDELLLSFVPKSVVKKYITNEEFKKEALKLWNKRVSPMQYSKDTNIVRRLRVLKRIYNYNKEYKNSYWK